MVSISWPVSTIAPAVPMARPGMHFGQVAIASRTVATTAAAGPALCAGFRGSGATELDRRRQAAGRATALMTTKA